VSPSIRALYLVGPTASGKTELAVRVAESVGAEIVSCDSRQIFRALDIGTAKPPPDLLARVPHHLVGVAEPTERWNAGRFAREALQCLHGIAERGRVALVVGGSGLYARALREGLASLPSDPRVRAELTDRLRRSGPEGLHAELVEIDPEAAAGIHPRNGERIVRALEVCRLAGRPISLLWRERPRSGGVPGPMLVLRPDRAWLTGRIDRRVVEMFDQGLLDEVTALLDRGFASGWPAFRTLGYPEAVRCLKGELDGDGAVAAIQQKTRQFARRQMIWFRGERDVRWIDVPGGGEDERVRECEAIAASVPLTPLPPLG